MNDSANNNKPLPFGIYFSVTVFLCLIGLFDTFYLVVSHYRNYLDVSYRSFCAISRAVNCDTVSQSSYSIFLNVPVAVWGMFGYLIVFTMLIFAWHCRKNTRGRIWASIFIISLIYSIISIILAIVSSYLIHSYCIMCILSYAVNFSLLFVSWLIFNRFGENNLFVGLKLDYYLLFSKRKITSFFVIAFLSIAVALIFYYPKYWLIEFEVLDANLKSGVTAEGYPWIGAEDPELTITEFTDYQCFQCRKMHFFLRQLIANYPDKIRLIHRHFPMDHEFNPLVTKPYHTGSGKMAIIGLYAQAKGQFWMMNDFLFNLVAKNKDFNTKTIADKMGVTSGEVVAALNNNQLRLMLKHDIAIGIKHDITGTPGYVINGIVYLGQIPPDILNSYIR